LLQLGLKVVVEEAMVDSMANYTLSVQYRWSTEPKDSKFTKFGNINALQGRILCTRT